MKLIIKVKELNIISIKEEYAKDADEFITKFKDIYCGIICLELIKSGDRKYKCHQRYEFSPQAYV